VYRWWCARAPHYVDARLSPSLHVTGSGAIGPETVAICMHRQHNAIMPSITVRNVPEDVRAELASRAARAGRSLQEHLRAELIELARKPSVEEVLAGARARTRTTSSRLQAARIVEHRDADRT
jgi:plasmid stability protein